MGAPLGHVLLGDLCELSERRVFPEHLEIVLGQRLCAVWNAICTDGLANSIEALGISRRILSLVAVGPAPVQLRHRHPLQGRPLYLSSCGIRVRSFTDLTAKVHLVTIPRKYSFARPDDGTKFPIISLQFG